MNKVHVTETPCLLEGYQGVFKPGKFGKCNLSAIIPKETIEALEEERPGLLDWGRSKHKNPRRATEKVEPWEELPNGSFLCKFSWKPEQAPPIVDTQGTVIVEELPLYSGSTVKLAFFQKPYATPDAYGTTLKLQGIQVISLSSGAGTDVGDLDSEAVADMFGTTAGFKMGEPNVVGNVKEEDEDDEF